MFFLTQINAFTSVLVRGKIQSMCYLNNNCTDHIEFKTEQTKTQNTERQLMGFLNEQVKNADL